jgi:hypothetical protein
MHLAPVWSCLWLTLQFVDEAIVEIEGQHGVRVCLVRAEDKGMPTGKSRTRFKQTTRGQVPLAMLGAESGAA